MTVQPVIKVGIMSEPELNFVFNSGYKFENSEICGTKTAIFDNGKIKWGNKHYDELLFSPVKSDEGTFTLKDVTIGVNFHWERKEEQTFEGELKIIVEGDKLTAINILPVESYLLSVISSEMSATASEEFLKAHAVISRSWLLAQIDKNKKIVENKINYSAISQSADELIKWYDREDHTNFDVCADDHCQRYQGVTRASTETVNNVIKKTFGEVLRHDGEICDARFSKCCGGVMEEFQYVWEDTKFPYLVALKDEKPTLPIPDLTNENEAEKWILTSPSAYCNTKDVEVLSQVLNNYDQETTDFYRWNVEYEAEYLSDLIRRRSGIDFGEIKELIPIARGKSGRLYKLKIVGSKKELIIGKELEIRRTLSESHLYSSAFVVRKEGSKFILTGAGWGHGVGLCQIGAAVMGAKGFSYKEILLHYFVNASIDKLY